MKKILYLLLILSLLVIPCEAKTPWTSKPPIGSQIDWSHPLSRGLVGCWLMNEKCGSISNNLVNAYFGNGVITGATWGSSIKGSKLLFSGTNIVNCGNKIIPNMTNQTWLAMVYPTTIDATNRRVMVIDDTTPATNRTALTVTNTVVANGIRIAITATGTNSDSIANAVNLNAWNLIGFTWKGRDISQVNIYSNGKNVTASVPGSATAWNDSAGGFRIGNRQDAAAPLLGSIAFCYLYNRVLSPSEIRQLYQEPYCFIKPQTDWDMIKAAVVGGVRRIFLIQ